MSISCEMKLMKKMKENAAKVSKASKALHVARYRLVQTIEEWQLRFSDDIRESDNIAQDHIMKTGKSLQGRRREDGGRFIGGTKPKASKSTSSKAKKR